MTDLKPGRELDALIAEKVMGISVSRVCACFNHSGIYETWENDKEPIPIKNYSTNIADACLVLEMLGLAEIAPYEICLAALKALE